MYSSLCMIFSLVRDDEASMVEEIATDVSNDLINFVISSDFEGFAGMEAHMKKMEPFLLLGSNEVRIIGIWVLLELVRAPSPEFYLASTLMSSSLVSSWRISKDVLQDLVPMNIARN